jgi:hypothetical protein
MEKKFCEKKLLSVRQIQKRILAAKAKQQKEAERQVHTVSGVEEKEGVSSCSSKVEEEVKTSLIQ